MHEEIHTRLVFKVIVSEQGHYSLWLLDREEPPGWRDTGQIHGSAMECLAHIKKSYFQETQIESNAISSVSGSKSGLRVKLALAGATALS